MTGHVGRQAHTDLDEVPCLTWRCIAAMKFICIRGGGTGSSVRSFVVFLRFFGRWWNATSACVRFLPNPYLITVHVTLLFCHTPHIGWSWNIAVTWLKNKILDGVFKVHFSLKCTLNRYRTVSTLPNNRCRKLRISLAVSVATQAWCCTLPACKVTILYCDQFQRCREDFRFYLKTVGRNH